ncbi:MAG TPA: DNA methyltransferase, partial [Candidatus Kapabacteria bacterium]
MSTAIFKSKGIRRGYRSAPLFETFAPATLFDKPGLKIKDRVNEENSVNDLCIEHRNSAATTEVPFQGVTVAGKNTYTYDAHTYHTKVPPQGIAELLKYYLPEGGLLLDPFAGSGMTGVAARMLGLDCILNDLSPAAKFIAEQYCRKLPPEEFRRGMDTIFENTREIRSLLYSTNCRECGKTTELQYVVWSYQVTCSECGQNFVLWDHCRSYGKNVKEHKILSEFPCPHCAKTIKKSRLKRLDSVPVLVGYKCCGSRQVEVTHSPSEEDLAKINRLWQDPPLKEDY